MKKLILVVIFILSALIAFFTIRIATAPTENNYTLSYSLPELIDPYTFVSDKSPAKQAVAVDNKLLYTNNTEVQPTASTAKTIMALMVMEQKPFELGQTGETITITQELYDQYAYQLSHNGSNTAVQLGEEISEYDALAAALLPSSNNMADSLAIWAFGSLEEYSAFANAKLKEWGINNTTVGSDASGLSPDTTSTASDLALIAQRLMANQVLAEIVGLSEHEIPVAGTVKNTNRLLGIDGIVGVKTGYTGYADYCLITAYRMDEHIITVASLGAQTREDSFELSHQTILELQQNFKESELAKKGAEIGYYESWWNGRTPIILDEDINWLAWKQNETNMTLEMSGGSGEMRVGINGKTQSYPVHAENYQAKPNFWQRVKYAFYQYK